MKSYRLLKKRARDLLTGITDSLNRVTTFRYDASGNKTAVENPNGKKVGYLYNKANRKEKITYDGAVKYTFGYDANGNRTKVFILGNTEMKIFHGVDSLFQQRQEL